ncbi:hypothetical protein SFRURICE_001726, partial [Spodoptera frugiperda]
WVFQMLPHIRIFSCVVGAFIDIQFHTHMAPRPETTMILRSYKELLRTRIGPATRCVDHTKTDLTHYTLHGSRLPSHRTNRAIIKPSQVHQNNYTVGSNTQNNVKYKICLSLVSLVVYPQKARRLLIKKRIFSYVVGAYTNIQIPIHMTPRPETTIFESHKDFLSVRIEPATQLYSSQLPSHVLKYNNYIQEYKNLKPNILSHNIPMLRHFVHYINHQHKRWGPFGLMPDPELRTTKRVYRGSDLENRNQKQQFVDHTNISSCFVRESNPLHVARQPPHQPCSAKYEPCT